jgi:glycine reductase
MRVNEILGCGTLPAMRLELARFPVHRIRLGERTAWADGMLTVAADEVRRLVLADPRLSEVGLDLVYPGDSARVLRALDAVEPLYKVAGPGCAFPGFLGPPDMAGRGRTHRLAGFSVVAVTEFPWPTRGVHAFEEGLMEMSGPGAAFSAGSDRANLLLLLAPGAAADNTDYDDAVRRATLRVASALAAVTRDQPPPEVEVFELSPVATGTPRVVWVHQVRAQGPMVQTFLYGHEMMGAVPTILHPNELLDGALVSGNYKTGSKTPTFRHTWHPSLIALYSRHTSGVDFAGVIVARGHHETEFLKRRSAQFVAKLARMLRADGALCTYEATGNTHIDFMLTVQALEREGIPAAAVVHEYGGPDGTDPALVDFAPEAATLASSGGIDRRVALPAVERAIGGVALAHREEPAAGPLDIPIQELYAATIEMNARGVVAREH